MKALERGTRTIGLVAIAALASCGSAPASEARLDPSLPAASVTPRASVAASGAPSASAPASAASPPVASASAPAAPAVAPPPPGKLCVVLYEETPQGRKDETFGYVDDSGKLAWIVMEEGRKRSKLTWDGDRLTRIERYDAERPTGGGVALTYGSKGELLRMTFLPSRVWWEGKYEGTFGKKKKREPRWLRTLLKNATYWPPHLPFQEGLTQPAFTGTLVAQYGQPQTYEVRCKLGGEGAGRCDDDYERVDTLKGFRPVTRESPKEDVTKEKIRVHQYEGDRLARIESKDTAGKVVYRTTFDYDDKGRLIRVHMTDFEATNITERLEHKCDVGG